MRTQIYNLNLNVGIGIPPSVKVSQGDIGRTIGFRIYEGARAYIPGSNDAVIITGTKPSGLGFTETCQINGTLVTVSTTAAMTQESGKIDAELRISNGTYDIGTANFVLYVEPAPHPSGTTDGTTEEARTVLEQCAQYAQEAHDAAGDVEPQIESLVDAAVADKMEEIEGAVQSVTDAAEQAVNDIAAAGEAVEESIPADYTALSTQVSQLQADLGAQSDLLASPTGEKYVPFEIGGVTYANNTITYAANTKRVRSREGFTIHLTPGSIVGLKDYTGKRYWCFWTTDGGTTWSRNGDWRTGDYTVVTEADYAFLIAENPDATQASADALASLFFVVSAENYQTSLTDELGRDNLVSNNMEYDGYLDASGNVVATTQNEVRYSDWIPVTEGKTYVVDFRVKLTAVSNWWFSVCFYDSEKAFISPRKAITSPVLDASGYYHASVRYTIPSGTAYMRVTGRTYGDCYTCVYEYVSVISDMQTQLNINRTAERKLRDEAIENAISTISPSVSAGAYSVVYSPVMYDYVCRGINHRGMADYPENTMIAFKASKTAGFYFVETDVRITSDGEFVLLHDASINRTARNADGTELASTVNINSITLAQAKTYDFGIYKGSQFAGEEIPSFEEFLTYCKRGCLHPYIEIKFTETTEAIHALVDTVHRYGLKDRSTYIANSVNALAMIAAYDPTARLGPIYGLTPTVANVEEAATLKTGFNDVIFCPRRPNDDVIEACIANRLNMEIWDYDVADSAILARANMVTGFVHMNKHAGKLIYNDANGITE